MKYWLTLLSALLLMVVPAAAQDEEGETYTDPQGLYTVPVPPGWTVTEAEGYTTLSGPEGDIFAHFLVTEAEDLRAAVDQAWETVDPAFDLEVAQVIDDPSVAQQAQVDEIIVINYDGGMERFAQGVALLFEEQIYVALYVGDLAAVQQRAAQLNTIAGGYTINAQQQDSLAGVEPQPVTEEMIAEIEAFVSEAIELADIPGAALAIVQDGEVIYANGFGVRDRESGEPVDTDTLFAIASTTKTFTTLAMASQVEDGVFDWDTPVIEVLPEFRVSDPELTQTITMRNLVCACSGVPRRDFELFFNGSELTAEGIVEQLATFEFFTDFGETFQYSNQMVAAGGYAAAAAAGAPYGELRQGYVDLIQARVLDPIGMERTTFDFDAAISDENVAAPYIIKLGEGYVPAEFSIERSVEAVLPAGGLWSSAGDMARYVLTLLNDGTAPDGTPVVTPEGLETLWEPVVRFGGEEYYGLGFIISSYYDVRVLSHAGNLAGYTSEMVFLPEADLGFVMLMNARGSNQISTAAYTRLLELVYGREENSAEILLGQLREDQEEELEEAAVSAEVAESDFAPVDAELAESFAGVWVHPELGEVTLTLEDDRLYLDAGEFRGEIIAQLDDDGAVERYIYSESPFEAVPVAFDEASGTLTLGAGAFSYEFQRAAG